MTTSARTSSAYPASPMIAVGKPIAYPSMTLVTLVPLALLAAAVLYATQGGTTFPSLNLH